MSDLVRARLNGVTTTMSRFFADSYGAEVLEDEPTHGGDGQPLPDVADVVDDQVATDGYEAEKVGDLKAEVARRNDGLEQDDPAYVSVDKPGNKPELVAALRASDARTPTDPAAVAGEDSTATPDQLDPKEQ